MPINDALLADVELWILSIFSASGYRQDLGL